MFKMLTHKYGLGSETLSPFVDSSVDDNVPLQTNPNFTNCCLNLSIFLNVRPI